MANSNKYLVAFTAQTDVFDGVATSHRLGTFYVSDGPVSLDRTLASVRKECGISDDFRIVTSFVCPMQPFERPTECRVTITLMPAGVGFAARLRQASRTAIISDDYTLGDAFTDLVNDEYGDSVIGWSYTPTTFYPVP